MSLPAAVLVPVGGFAPFLAEALDAALAAEPAAVVVCDDAADPPVVLHPDHTAAAVVRRDARGGPAAARATALAAAPDVPYVALCDADDAWEPGALAASVAALEAHPDAGLAFGRALVVGVDGRETGERWPQPAPGLHAPDAFACALYAANPLPTSSVVLRRSALEAAGGFEGPVPVAEDWELWLRIARAGFAAVCVPDAVVRYRRHPDGLTADVAGLARAQLVVHREHAGLVGAAEAHRAEAADLRALARGLVRDGDAAGARRALAEAAALEAPATKDRALAAALKVPGAARLAGRADPYR